MNQKIIILIIFLLAFFFRLFGLDWDRGSHLHPDERFLTMVASDLSFPKSLREYFNTQSSPLNPHSYPQYQFIVYGTFPLFFVKALAAIFHQDHYATVHLWGRGISAFFDSLNILFLFLIAKKIWPKKSKTLFIPSLLYAFCPLALQLSHFFAVDTFLTTFIFAAFTSLVYGHFVLAAVFFGLALSSKISAVIFAPIFTIFVLKNFPPAKNFFKFLLVTCCLLLVTFLIFRVFQPYAFIGLIKINPRFLADLQTLKGFSDPTGWYPPAIQWMSKKPLVFPLQNIIFWGIGLPLSALGIFSVFTAPKKHLPFPLLLSLIWIVLLFLFHGMQFSHTMRYFLPVYPFICLLIGFFFTSTPVSKSFICLHLLFGFSFLAIYSRPHSRVIASSWLLKNLPSGSAITNESWDDPLPLGQSPFTGSMLSLYDPDTSQKWQTLNPVINSADYLILSSNRLWGSIPKVPQKYPQTSKFYQDLFSGNLNFKKLISFTSYPGFRLPFLTRCYYFGPTDFPGLSPSWFSIENCSYPGLYFRDDTAEEAFTVYDHPQVLIFSRQ